jgi:hypothetical protein
MDDVPIPLRPAFDSPYPSDETVLRAVEKRIREFQTAKLWGTNRDGSRVVNIVIQVSAKDSSRAVGILIRHSPGVALPNRTFIIEAEAARALREAGVKFREIAQVPPGSHTAKGRGTPLWAATISSSRRFCGARQTPTSRSRGCVRSFAIWVSRNEIRGSHHIYSRAGVAEILNLQPKGSKAKSYQVKQVRDVILKYKMGAVEDA